jgi:hypothetical protein
MVGLSTGSTFRQELHQNGLNQRGCILMLASLSKIANLKAMGAGAFSNLPRLIRMPRTDDQSPFSVRGKTAHSVDGL